MRLNPFLLPGLAIAIFFGTVLSAQAAGVWSTSGRDATVLDALTPADVKGWMTLQQVSDGIPIPRETLYALMEIPADIPPKTALKDLEPVMPGFEVSTLRDRLTAWVDESAEPVIRDTSSPTPTAVPATVTPTTAAPMPGPTVTALAHPAVTREARPSPARDSAVALNCDVRGRMTVQETADACGITVEALVAAAGLPAETPPGAVVKDLVSEGQLPDIETLRVAIATVQAEPRP